MRPCFRLLAPIAGTVSVLLAGGGDLFAQAGGGRPLAPAMTPPGIEFSVEQSAYSLGDTITILLANESDRTILYNLCHATMERAGAGGWDGVSRSSPDPAGALFYCPDIGYDLRPSASVTANQPVIEEMLSGVYRFQVDVRWGDINTQLISNEFRVVR